MKRAFFDTWVRGHFCQGKSHMKIRRAIRRPPLTRCYTGLPEHQRDGPQRGDRVKTETGPEEVVGFRQIQKQI